MTDPFTRRNQQADKAASQKDREAQEKAAKDAALGRMTANKASKDFAARPEPRYPFPKKFYAP